VQTINIHAAKTQLSRLAEQAAAGEEIIIAKAGKPVCRLMPLTKEPRKPGVAVGEPDAYDEVDTPFSKASAIGAEPAQAMIARFAGCWDDMSDEEFAALEAERQQRRTATRAAFDGRRADAAGAG
jgi:prevent-host-death family protein